MLANKARFRAAAAATFLSVILSPVAAARVRAQSPGSTDTAEATVLNKVTVTATRSPKTVFRTASPVVVVDSARIRATLPNGVAELLRESPGVDITGTGANQGRPVIRGQRGQRILLLRGWNPAQQQPTAAGFRRDSRSRRSRCNRPRGSRARSSIGALRDGRDRRGD